MKKTPLATIMGFSKKYLENEMKNEGSSSAANLAHEAKESPAHERAEHKAIARMQNMARKTRLSSLSSKS